MSNTSIRRHALALATLLALGLCAPAALAQSGPTDSIPVINGLSVDPTSDGTLPRRLLIATKYGVLRASPDGTSSVASDLRAAIVGFSALPNAPEQLFLSGFDTTNQPLGLMKSDDGGATWHKVGTRNTPLAEINFAGPHDTRMVAIGTKIEISADAGATWRELAKSPEEVFSVALTPTNTSRIYAATMKGLLQSDDTGETWHKVYDSDQPATLVASLSGNRVMAFVYGVGLIVTGVAAEDWNVLNGDFSDRYLLNLIEDPANPETLYATADTGAILMSRTGGKTWISYEGSDKATPERISTGATLFKDNCQICHGVKGIGESPSDPGAKDEFGFKAPALNDDMHAWHHSDTGLSATIHEGSSRNKRMIAWQDVLSDDEIDDILIYVKSLWSLRSLACQGGRHMGCMGN